MVGSFQMGNAYFRGRTKLSSRNNNDLHRVGDHAPNNNSGTSNVPLGGATISGAGGVLGRGYNFGNSLAPESLVGYNKRSSQFGGMRKESSNSNYSNNSKSGHNVSYFNAIKQARSVHKTIN
jgi:hypothetical protein